MTLPTYRHSGEALVLKSRRYGEADLILTCFMAELGKLDALGRGARKPSSRKSGHLEPCTEVALSLRRSKWLPEITEVQTRQSFPGCRSSLETVTLASYACELLDSLTQPGDSHSPDSALYELLRFTLGLLNDDPSVGDLALRWYELQILTLTGFQLELRRCTECGQPAQAQACHFSIVQGGMVCRRCGPGLERLEPLGLDEFKALRFLQRSPWQEVIRYQFAEGVVAESGRLLQRFLGTVLERQLRTQRFRRQIRK